MIVDCDGYIEILDLQLLVGNEVYGKLSYVSLIKIFAKFRHFPMHFHDPRLGGEIDGGEVPTNDCRLRSSTCIAYLVQ